MNRSAWDRLVTRLFKKQHRTLPREKRRKLVLEWLEVRLAPATDAWTGLATGLGAGQWSAASNWTLGRAPQAGDDLVFGATAPTATHLTNNNIPLVGNVGGVGGVPVVYNSITFSVAGYFVDGNALALSGNINVGSNLGNENMSVAIKLTPPAGSLQQTFTVNTGSDLILGGKITAGPSAASQTLTKAGGGTLELMNDNSGFTGAVVLANSGGIVAISNANALGAGAVVTGVAAAGTVTVNPNSQLQVRNVAGVINERLKLNGVGTANDGGLLNFSGNNLWAGAISMDLDGGVGAAGGTQLNISGQITDTGAGHNITKFGAGKVIFSYQASLTGKTFIGTPYTSAILVGNTYRGTTTVDEGTLTIRDPLSLGADVGGVPGNAVSGPFSGAPGAGTIVKYNSTTGRAGTLQLEFTTLAANDPNGILRDATKPFNALTNPYIGFQVFNELLTLNGPGFGGIGALENLNGNNIWGGNVVLDNPSPTSSPSVLIGVAAPSPGTPNTELTISGIVSDPTVPINATALLTKVGGGRLNLTNADTYSAGTLISAGSINILDSKALGTGGATVNNGAALELSVDAGLDGTALRTHGRNLGFDSVTKNGPVQEQFNGVGVAGTFTTPNLPSQEVYVSGTTGTFTLTFYGRTTTALAFNATAAQVQTALNALTSISAAGGVTVTRTPSDKLYRITFNVGSAQLPLMTATSSLPALIVGVNAVYGLNVSTPLTIFGTGINNTGALRSISGINTYSANVGLAGVAGIGVELDTRTGHYTDNYTYFTNDYSLTINGDIGGGSLVKVRPGHLILPNANSYSGTTSIQSGWITAETFGFDAFAGVFTGSLGIQQANLVQTRQVYTTVADGAALHLKAKTPGASLSINNNFILSGLGISHPFDRTQMLTVNSVSNYTLTLDGIHFTVPILATATAATVQTALNNLLIADGSAGAFVTVVQIGNVYTITFGGTLAGQDVPKLISSVVTNTVIVNTSGLNKSGAIVNLDDTNNISGLIQLKGIAGIGVQQVDAIPTGKDRSQLTLTGQIFEVKPPPITVPATATGGSQESSTIIETGSNSGTITLHFDPFNIPDDLRIYYGPRGTPGSTRIFDTTLIGDTVANPNGYDYIVPYGPPGPGGPSTQIEIVVDEGGGTPGTAWTYDATITPNSFAGGGGITKLGSERLVIQSSNTYTGPVNVTAGVLLVQSDTALGAGNNSTTTVEAGAALELGNTITTLDGGIQGGIGIWGEHLILNGTGNTLFGDSALAALSLIPTVSGIATPNDSSTTTPTATAPIKDPVIATDDSWHGPVTLGTSTVISTQTHSRIILAGPIDDDSNTAINGSDITIIGGGEVDLAGPNTYRGTTFINQGVLTISDSSALGGTAIGEVQKVAVTGAVGGSTKFTLTFNGKTTAPITYTVINTGNPAADAAATALANAASIQAALNLLTTIGGAATVAGAVTVAPTLAPLTGLAIPGSFDVTFGGSLGGFHQSLLTGLITSGPGLMAPITLTRDGAGGTIIANGASLQLAGAITIAGEPLLVNGTGNSNLPNIPTQWFAVGPAPTANGQTAGNSAVAGRVTGSVVDPNDPNVIYISTSGGGAWKTIDGGKSWRPMFDAIPEIQTVNVTAASGSATLTLDGVHFATISVNDTGLQVQTALNTLVGLSGYNGAFVTVVRTGSIYKITYGGTLAGYDVPQLVSSAPATFTVNTIEQGHDPKFAMYIGAIAIDPNASGTLYLGTGETNNTNDSYYGTGIYKSTDYGVTWALVLGNQIQSVTINGGVIGTDTFTLKVTPPTGPTITTAPILVGASASLGANSVQAKLNAALSSIGGFVSVSQSGSNTYLITFLGSLGKLDLIPIIVAGSGGVTGTVTITAPTNPFYGKGISKIVVDPSDSSRLYIADGDSNTGRVINGTTGGAGIWRLQSGVYFDMTNVVSANRQFLNGQLGHPPKTPGPDDDFRVSFPLATATWSDVQLIYTVTANQGNGPGPSVPVLYASLGTTNSFLNPNGVYRCENPTSQTPVWYIGDPGAPADQVESLQIVQNQQTDGFEFQLSFNGSGPSSIITYSNSTNQSGTIAAALNALSTIGAVGGIVTVSLTSQDVTQTTYSVSFGGTLGQSPQGLIGGFINAPPVINVGITTPGGGADTRKAGEFPVGQVDGTDNGSIKLSVVAGPTLNSTTAYASTPFLNGSFRAVFKSSNGGKTWAPAGGPSDYLSGTASPQGNYDNAILAVSASHVYVGGAVNNSTGQTGQILETVDGGGAWNDISVLAKAGPHSAQHSIVLDGSSILFGNDGGIWRLNNTWEDLNGNLAIAQVNGISSDPTSLFSAFAGLQSNGTARFANNSQTWTIADSTSGGEMGGGQVFIDPKNRQNIYAVQHQVGTNDIIRRSQDGGQNWTTIVPFVFDSTLAVDPVDPRRVLVGSSSGLIESLDRGNSFVDLASPISVSAFALASHQGTFSEDFGFPRVVDQGASAYDSKTVYVTDGFSIAVTKDEGQTWQNRTLGVDSIFDIVVDPRNRDTVYITRNAFGGEKIYKSTDAGKTWNGIGTAAGLPDVPTWKLVIDPRNGNLYVGTDIGVFTLATGSTAWQRFGAGMPNTQVKSLELNQNTNTLLAGTYGRSAFQLFLKPSLTSATSVSAALVALSGSSFWTGPVILNGDPTLNQVVIGAYGTQDLSNGLSAAQLTIQGTISDLTAGSNPTLIKIGQGDVIFSGPNIYGGVTDIREGALVANNLQSLGGNTNGTVVHASDVKNAAGDYVGASLKLRSNLNSEQVTLYGDGISFDGHYTGAFRNESGFNTFTGQLLLGTTDPLTVHALTSVTIGADSNSQLTITGGISDKTGPISLVKEGTGTVVLASANTFGGLTTVDRGALQVENNTALNALGGKVLDGAQIQIQSPTDPISGLLTSLNVNVPLILSGTGINGTGALLNTGGNNTWGGNILFQELPGFSPFTTPTGIVAIASANAGDTLTLAGILSESSPSGLSKIGQGTVALQNANTYTGATYVREGILDVQNANALGNRSNTYASVQQITTVSNQQTGIFTINFNGGSSTVNWGANAGTVQGAIQSLLPGGATVSVVRTEIQTTTLKGPDPLPNPGGAKGLIYTVTFGGTLAQTTLPITASGSFGTTAAASVVAGGGIDAHVDTGSELQLDDAAGMTITHKVSLNGTGVGNLGALHDLLGNNTVTGPINLETSSSIGVEAGFALTLTGAMTATQNIDSSFAADLTKVDPGTLIFSNTATYAGPTNVQTGTVQVDGTIGAVLLAGGTLSGTGNVGAVTTTGSSSVIEPGDTFGTTPTGSPTSVGTLTSTGGFALAPTDQVFVDLIGNPLPNNDLLQITGGTSALALDNAVLGGFVASGVTVGESFTIVQTDGLTNPFDNIVTNNTEFFDASQGTAMPVAGGAYATVSYIQGIKFVVDYFPDHIIVTRQLANVSLALSALVAAPVYSQPETFAATLTPEVGSPPPTGKVDFAFTVVATGITTHYLISIDPLTGTATFDPTAAMPLGTGAPLALGGYSVSASYNGVDSHGIAAFTPASNGPVNVTVSQAPTVTTLTPSDPAAVYGEAVILSAAVNVDPSVVPTQVTGALQPTGTVIFTETGVFSVTKTVVGASHTATFDISTLPTFLSVGTHHITAAYSGDTNYIISTTSYDLVIAQDSTTITALTVTPTPLDFGTAATLKATITPNAPGSGTPTGTADFFIGPVGSMVFLGTGTVSTTAGVTTASIPTTAGQLPAGVNQTITVIYSGDTNFASTSNSFLQTVRGTTAETLTSNASSVVVGQALTFTAKITSGYAFGPLSGTVNFFDLTNGGAFLGTGSVIDTSGTIMGASTSGYATLTVGLAGSVGSHTIQASYLGSTNYAGSTATFNQTVIATGTRNNTTTVVSDNNPSTVGQPVTFTATVTDSLSAIVPTGTITFKDGATILGYGTLAASGVAGQAKASFITTTLILGNHPITVIYSGSSVFASKTATLAPVQVVNATGNRTSSTILAASTPTAVFGQPVTFTATVTDTGGVPVKIPTGYFAFYDGATLLGYSARMTTFSPSQGRASFTTTALSTGAHSVTAVYLGDANFAKGANSSPVDVTVNQDATTTTLTSDAKITAPSLIPIIPAGTVVTFTATVAPVAPGSGLPTGTVTFMDTTSGATLGVATVFNGVATLSVALTTVGMHSIKAIYSSDTNFLGSMSSVKPHLVTRAASLASASASTLLPATPITFTTKVEGVLAGLGTPTGNVSIYIDGILRIANATLVNGKYSFASGGFAAGNHTIRIIYSGDSTFLNTDVTYTFAISAGFTPPAGGGGSTIGGRGT